MKQIFILILILILCCASIVCKAQFFDNDCGTWKPKPVEYTEWQSVDTLKKGIIKDTARKWVYGQEKMLQSSITKAKYCPCGCGDQVIWQQYRVCKITGIRQTRYKIQEYEYIQKPKSEYQQVIDSIKNQR